MGLRCCGQSFDSWTSLQTHISSDSLHQGYRKCRKGFPTTKPFKQHMRTSGYHTQHQTIYSQNNAIHAEGNATGTQTTTMDAPADYIPYDGIPAAVIKPIFKAACRLRFSNPTVQNLVRSIETTLDKQIVSAILEGARRLLPPDNSPEGLASRKAEMAMKATQALEAETAFILQIQRFQPRSLTEEEQNENIHRGIEAGSVNIVKSTPDVLFLEATLPCGFEIKWIEYKNMFGFKSNPFVHQKIKKQLKRYLETFGNGMVVYRLGYEVDHLTIEGLKVMRESDVLQWMNLRQIL